MDPVDPVFLSLMLAIEEPLANTAGLHPEVTDGRVLIALEQLGRSPEAPAGRDSIVAVVQLRLRLALSIHDYSRQDVRRAVRVVAKSVARHNKASGPRGYLTFIRRQLRR